MSSTEEVPVAEFWRSSGNNSMEGSIKKEGAIEKDDIVENLQCSKRQHDEKFEDFERWDPNIDNPYILWCIQENNIGGIEVVICYIHVAIKSQSKHNQKL